MFIKMKEIISKEELSLMLKYKKVKKFKTCSECPIHFLKIRGTLSCRRIIIELCGKNPASCNEAYNLIYNFLGKTINQNKI